MSLYLVVGLAALLVGAVVAIYVAGRRAGANAVTAAVDAATVQVQKGQLDDSTLPRDRKSVEDVLRSGRF